MAYDPEARESSNTAMIISIAVLVLMAVGALAYYASRPAPEPVAVVPSATEHTTVINNSAPAPVNPSVVVNPPATGPDVVVVPGTSTTKETTRVIERDRTKVVPAPDTGTSSGGDGASGDKAADAKSSSTTNINISPGAGTTGGASSSDAGTATTKAGGAAGGTEGAAGGAGGTSDAGTKGY